MALTTTFVLLGAGAIAVDLGQVYAKRANLQKAVDLAVLSAAAELDGTDTCTSEAISAASTSLTANWIDSVNDPIDVNLAGAANDDDGFIRCTGWEVELWAPKATVDYEMARAFAPGGGSVEVPAYAKAGVFSPEGVGTMPAFAASGCDFGPQTLLDDSTADPVPTPDLREDSPLPTGPLPTIDVLNPSTIPEGTTTVVPLRIEGNNHLGLTTQVAFTTAETGSDIHTEVAYATRASGLVMLTDIPPIVKTTPGVWYVRVSKDAGPSYTRWSNAMPFLVGDAILECDSESSDGNFGALRMPRTDATPGSWVPMNIAHGVQFDLSRYPNAHDNWECSSADGSAILASNQGTNCVDTETGLPASDAESGLITAKGITGPARLAEPNHPACGGSQQTINFGGSIGSVSFNDDRLDCFLDSGATDSYQYESYSGPAVLSADIFESPRFTWIPVFGKDAETGGSRKYQVVDFRPAFIEGPTDAAANEYNGLGFKATGPGLTLRSVKVTFFNANALPESMSGGPTMTYIGVGTKVIVLVE